MYTLISSNPRILIPGGSTTVSLHFYEDRQFPQEIQEKLKESMWYALIMQKVFTAGEPGMCSGVWEVVRVRALTSKFIGGECDCPSLNTSHLKKGWDVRKEYSAFWPIAKWQVHCLTTQKIFAKKEPKRSFNNSVVLQENKMFPPTKCLETQKKWEINCGWSNTTVTNDDDIEIPFNLDLFDRAL